MIELVFFVFFGTTAVAAALSLVLQKNPINSALSLIVVIASMGGLFLLLNAAFLAVLQIIIYAGAIMALFLFVLMMVDVDKQISSSWHSYSRIALVLLLAIAAASIWAIRSSTGTFTSLTSTFSVRELSKQLFSSYLFAFESIGVLIVSSVIGALYAARKEEA
jgi:NADH-quinone oxidoreductase subunit J